VPKRSVTDDHIPLYFKKTGYNWLSFSREPPPALDAERRQVAQSQVDVLWFESEDDRDLAMLLLNGKWAFALWRMLGDDFHVTASVMNAFPLNPKDIEGDYRQDLVNLADELDSLMKDSVSFKLNAGINVGTYNLARCRAITDRSDAIFGEILSMGSVWSDVELMYAETVLTDFTGDLD
jgi:hypothetical protein